MSRTLTYLLLLTLGIPASARPCDCGPPKAVCAYLGADAIFVGRVSFSNDDGSERFTQSTLVRFEVEERFKGVSPSVNEMWVDPGSLTSCYKNYKLGERYLVFAARKPQIPNESAS